MIVDSFAGGGGASLGVEMATGRSPDIAINHDAEALAMHQRNHPSTTHYQEDVWKVDPTAVTGGRPVGLMWLSPDCKHHSKAAQVRMCGNSVCPPIAAALVSANYSERRAARRVGG